MTASVEILRRVYDDEEGVFIEVHPSPDVPDAMIEVSTLGDKKSEEWFGKVLFSMSPDFAIALGLTLVASGQAMKDEKK
jgi:hypothetical protein